MSEICPNCKGPAVIIEQVVTQSAPSLDSKDRDKVNAIVDGVEDAISTWYHGCSKTLINQIEKIVEANIKRVPERTKQVMVHADETNDLQPVQSTSQPHIRRLRNKLGEACTRPRMFDGILREAKTV